MKIDIKLKYRWKIWCEIWYKKNPYFPGDLLNHELAMNFERWQFRFQWPEGIWPMLRNRFSTFELFTWIFAIGSTFLRLCNAYQIKFTFHRRNSPQTYANSPFWIRLKNWNPFWNVFVISLKEICVQHKFIDWKTLFTHYFFFLNFIIISIDDTI